MIVTRFWNVTLVFGFGTIFAHRPNRLGVHNDNPRLCTSPINDKNINKQQTKITRKNDNFVYYKN